MSVTGKQWLTAAELAALKLPGLPKGKRRVNDRALEQRWALALDASGAPLARRRVGRGGGLEYHVDLLPAAARLELARRGLTVADAPAECDPSPARAGSWAWLESQSDSVKAEARRRVEAVADVEAFEQAGLTRTAAVACAAAEASVGSSTIWGWLDLIDGVERADRLPHLAPRRRGGGAEAAIDEDAWRFFLSDYLRLEKPTLRSCYDRTHRAFPTLELPHWKSFKRKLDREVDPRLVVAKREGMDKLSKALPPQQRTVRDLVAMQLVNIDGHRFDVFCRFPGRPEPARPMMVAIQDVYSRKILAWRIGESESAVLTRLAFADLFRNWGIPAECLLDNGRAFASKWITGGAKTRYRFKVREEEPTGLLTGLGVKIRWATPYHGQAKPIERAFRDLAEAIKDPRLAGAWTGNHIDNKPENHGSRAVPVETFAAVVEQLIRAHNARPGRRSESSRGQSFDDVFHASYTRFPVGKATPEQLRVALLAADEVRTDRQSGALTLMGNRYWTPELSAVAGRRVTVRFDPDDLTQPVHVYDSDGHFLVTAGILEQTGFLDAGAAQQWARQHRELKKHVRRVEEIEGLLAASDLAAMLPEDAEDAPAPQPVVLRPVRHHGFAAAAVRHDPSAPPIPAFIDRFTEAERQLRIVND